MGTNLARNNSSYVVRDGQIEGDSIRCPYHAWRFGPDGKCNDIPYSKAPIPKAACVHSPGRSWRVSARSSSGTTRRVASLSGRPRRCRSGTTPVGALEVRPPGHD